MLSIFPLSNWFAASIFQFIACRKFIYLIRSDWFSLKLQLFQEVMILNMGEGGGGAGDEEEEEEKKKEVRFLRKSIIHETCGMNSANDLYGNDYSAS